MKLRSAWRVKTSTGYDYYTNEEMSFFKSRIQMAKPERIFIMSKANINDYENPKNYSAFFPPF